MKSSFTENNIFISASFDDFDSAESDISFVCNIYIDDRQIWWTHAGGTSGGNLQSFLARLQIDQHFVFGPPRKQRTWPLAKLEELGAVGVYQVVDSKKGSAK